MYRLFKDASKKGHLSPEVLVHVGEKKAERVRLTVIDYDGENFHEKELSSVEECFPYKDTSTVTWINVGGLHQVEVIEALGKRFDIHPLVLEDILNTTQRPKVEDYGSYVYLVFKMISYEKETSEILAEQISLIVSRRFVISFQENGTDVFDPVRERIRTGRGRIRGLGTDYLAYALVDTVVDHYFNVLEKVGDEIEDLEEELLRSPSLETSETIHILKREMLFLRRSVWPLREVISLLLREESPLVQKETLLYLRDLYDHTIQVIDTIETFRDMLSAMLDVYLSSVSNRMNSVMKVLTGIATIFMPLTFMVGLYGMNFKFMPELEWRYGYPVVLVFMACLAVSLYTFFKRRGWI